VQGREKEVQKPRDGMRDAAMERARIFMNGSELSFR
jgi:hypothetical protein